MIFNPFILFSVLIRFSDPLLTDTNVEGRFNPCQGLESGQIRRPGYLRIYLRIPRISCTLRDFKLGNYYRIVN